MEAKVLVDKALLDNMLSEVAQIKEWIPQMINSDVVQAYKSYSASQRELLVLREDNKQLKADVTRWRNKFDTSQAELKLQKELNHKATVEIAGLKEQLSLEVRYCAKLGSSACELLWSLSKLGFPHATLHTTSMKKFLETFDETLTNFAHVDSKVEHNSDEMRLVESLCGTLVNATASEEGRDYVVESNAGRDIINSVVSLLPRLSPSILRLLLNFLFNVSLHYSGQAILLKELPVASVEEVLSKGREAQVVLCSLRLLQSLYSDEELVVSPETILFCSTHQNSHVRELSRQMFEHNEP